MPQITLNGIDAIRARVNIPWRGVWNAEVEITPEQIEAGQLLAAAAAPVVLIIGTSILTGVVDPKGSGTFSERAVIRVVGGRGAWGTQLPAQHFYGPGGSLLSTLVYNATAVSAGGEVVVDAIPERLGDHFVRAAGPASDVFRGKDWFVDPITGITAVSSWPPLVFDPGGTLADLDINAKRATLYTENLLLPGTVLVDPDRLGAVSLTVREVEQHFSSEGSMAYAWCAEAAVSPLADTLASFVKSAADTRYLRLYKYRLILMEGGSKVALQVITAGAPDLHPVDEWTGLSGAIANLLPGTEIVVGFVGREPVLVTYSPLATPLTQSFAAATSISMVAPAINLGATPLPLAFGGQTATAVTAIAAYIAAITAAFNANPAYNPTLQAALVAAGGVAAAALASLPAAIPTIVVKGS